MLAIEFDPDKDAANLAKHGVSLSAGGLEVRARVEDGRFVERRLRAYGTINGAPHSLAYTLRGDAVISLRRVHAKEYLRHVT